jgi:glutathione S-transferase
MIKFYGLALSNYSNMVKTALLEKGIPFEEIEMRPSKDQNYLAKSPMGKIPCIETEQGFLTETHPILDYLEEISPTSTLLPVDPFHRAKVRELVQALELYIELVARRGIGVIFGKEVPIDVIASIDQDLKTGSAAISKLVQFSPWIAGKEFTYADLFGYYTFSLSGLLAEKLCGLDLFQMVPGSKEWFSLVKERESVKRADADAALARQAMRSK